MGTPRATNRVPAPSGSSASATRSAAAGARAKLTRRRSAGVSSSTSAPATSALAGAANSLKASRSSAERGPARVVVELEIGDDRDLGPQPQEAGVGLVGLCHHPLSSSPARVGRLAAVGAGKLAAEEEGRIGAQLAQGVDAHRGRRGLAVGARDRDQPPPAAELGQQLAAMKHPLAALAGDRELGVVLARSRSRRRPRRPREPGKRRGRSPARALRRAAARGTRTRRGRCRSPSPRGGGRPGRGRSCRHRRSRRSGAGAPASPRRGRRRRPTSPRRAPRRRFSPPRRASPANARPPTSLRAAPGRRAAQRPPRRSRSGVSSSSRDHDRGAALGQPARVLGLMVRGRVRIGDQDRGAARRGDLEHRAAGAGEHQVGGREHLAEVGLVLDQGVALGGAGALEPLAERRVVAPSGDVEHPEAGPGPRSPSSAASLIERAPRLPPKTSRQRSSAPMPKRERAASRSASSTARGTGRPVTT